MVKKYNQRQDQRSDSLQFHACCHTWVLILTIRSNRGQDVVTPGLQLV